MNKDRSPDDVATEPSPGRAWVGPLLEALVAIAVAAAFVASCVLIKVYPLDRVGQISGLAHLAFRFSVIAIALLVALILAARVRGGRQLELTTRLACAAIAGLATGMIAGGILVALRGTPWGLNGKGGDAGALASWASALHRGEDIPPTYPPLALHVLHYYSDVVGLTPDLAMKHLQIMGVAVSGPVAYLSWRLFLRPPWALAIGVLSTLPLIEPYKPFPNLVLVVFVPLAVLFLDQLRKLPERSTRQVLQASVGFGVAFGVLCLTYSGWFQWAAPGLFVATMVVFPWRKAPRKAVLLLALTGVVFLLLSGKYLAGVLFDPAGKIADTYIYFDVHTDPMYVAMWRNDTPGPVGVWPPIGELGGVGLFTILMAVGLGLAIALGRKTTLVIGLASIMAGAWVFRFFYARTMFETKLVQLYPRTTPLILYCLLVLGGLAVFWLVERRDKASVLRGPSALIGGLATLLLVLGSAGSATSDRYMPVNTDPPGTGWLTYMAHKTRWAQAPIHTSRPMSWLRRRLVPPPVEPPAAGGPDEGAALDGAASPGPSTVPAGAPAANDTGLARPN